MNLFLKTFIYIKSKIYKKFILDILSRKKIDTVYCILNSSYQINILNNLRIREKEFFLSEFIIFDLNKNIIGNKQFEFITKKNKVFIYKGRITKLKFLFFIITNLFNSNQIIHGNYNSISFKLLALLFSNRLNAIDDGGNTALFPFRIKNKFRKFYTIFPEITKIKHLKKFSEIIDIKFPKENKNCSRNTSNFIYLCASADVEVGRVNEEDYLRIVKTLVKKHYNYKTIYYYPHRRESKNKLENLKRFIRFKNFEILNAKVNFEEYYENVKHQKAPIISMGSTLEKTLNIFLSEKITIYPVRYPEFIQKRYILNYLIYTSLLSNSYNKKNIYIINNNKVKNLKSFIKSKNFLDQNFTKLKLNNFLKKKILKNYKNFYKWSGHPLAIDKNFKIYVLNSCKDDRRLLYTLSISPTLLIGKLID